MKKRQTYLFIISLIIPSAQVFSQTENKLYDSLTINDKILNINKNNDDNNKAMRNTKL